MRIYILFFFLIFISACAVKVAPTGGLKDVTPPEFIDADPPNFNTDFKGKEIKLNFDEYVQVVDVQNQLVISPLISPKPEVKAYKKTITVKLPDSLSANTTYTINFGKSVADVHETNVYEGLQYVFSTGTILDSLTCVGVVKNASTLAPVTDITVMLYRKKQQQWSDSLVFKVKPDYFAKTNSAGAFTIKNISEGVYYIFALDDKNNNYICDNPLEEPIAFINHDIVIPQIDSIILLRNFPKASKLQLKDAKRTSRYKAAIVFTREADSIQITDLNSGTKFNGLTDWSEFRDTLMLYITDTIQDSLNLVLDYSESPNDTVHLLMKTSSAARFNKLSFDIMQSPADNDISEPLKIVSSNPLKDLNTKPILYFDSAMINPSDYTFSKDIQKQNVYFLVYKWKENLNYSLLFPKDKFSDVYGNTNDTIKLSYTSASSRTSAMLNVKVTNAEAGSSYLLQLTTEKIEIVRQLKIDANGEYHFNFLRPGMYKLRVVKDDNKNGKWDSASFDKLQQAELVNLSPASIQLRSNWELETEISCPK